MLQYASEMNFSQLALYGTRARTNRGMNDGLTGLVRLKETWAEFKREHGLR